MITDTQILSYYFRGTMAIPAEPIRISSITAAEFLLIQSDKHNQANYYPMLPARYGRPHGMTSLGATSSPARAMFDSRRHAAMGKRRTDQLILDFGPKVPTYVEFGSLAISQLINEQHHPLYAASISHLDKAEQKKLLDRFRFLLSQRVSCITVTPSTASLGLDLLGRFMDRYQLKENNRNSVNDVLILATAIVNETQIFTKDNLLARFAGEELGVSAEPRGEHLHLDFSTPVTLDRRKSLESKGYINRGWQILERRGRAR